MSDGKAIYQEVCSAQEPEALLVEMKDKHLRELMGYLGRKGEINGVPGLVWGMCLVEAAERFRKGKS